MLQTFSQNNPESVTSTAVLQPQIDGVVVYGANTVLSSKTCNIQIMEKQNSKEIVANVWKQWKETEESFSDFVERIQEVNYPKALTGFSLFNREEPQYLFPNLVRLHFHYI